MKKQKQAGDIPLSAKQAAELRQVQEGIGAINARVGGLTRQRMMVDQQIAAAIGDAERAEAGYRERVGRFASLCGIDVDARPEETGETWHFDYATMTFKRQAFEKSSAPAPK